MILQFLMKGYLGYYELGQAVCSEFEIEHDYDGRGRKVGKIVLDSVPRWLPPSRDTFKIKKVIFNDPATIVLWEDGTKTVVKCMEGDTFSQEMGLAMCICKKVLGSQYHKVFNEWVHN